MVSSNFANPFRVLLTCKIRRGQIADKGDAAVQEQRNSVVAVSGGLEDLAAHPDRLQRRPVGTDQVALLHPDRLIAALLRVISAQILQERDLL